MPEARGEIPPDPEAAEREIIPRRLYLRRADVHKYGATPHCPGCSHRDKPHTETCRRRIEEEMEKDEGDNMRVHAAREKKVATTRNHDVENGAAEAHQRQGATKGDIDDEVEARREETEVQQPVARGSSNPQRRRWLRRRSPRSKLRAAPVGITAEGPARGST